MRQYVIVRSGSHTREEDASMPIDTEEQIEAAVTAMVNAGQWSARIYRGEPDCPNSYATGQSLYAYLPNDSTRAL